MSRHPAQILDLVAATLVVGFATGLVVFPFPNPDLFWLLATGRRMIDTHAFIYSDPFTFTIPGTPWSPQSWLAAIAYFLVHKLGGFGALTVLRILFVGAMAAFTLRTLRRIGVSWAMTAPLLVLGFLVAHTRLTDRGQLFEYAILAWWVGFLLQSHAIPGRRFFVIPIVVQLFWVQLHPSFLLGPALTAIFFAGEWVSSTLPGFRPLQTHHYRRAFALVGALILACLVNPNPREFLLGPFDPAQRELLSRFTLEWKSPFDPAIAVGNFHPYYEWLLALAVVAIVSNIRRLPLAPVALIAATAALSLQSHRFRVEFALVAIPMIALLFAISPVLGRFRQGQRGRRRTESVTRVAAAIGLAIALVLIVVERGRFTEARTARASRPDRAVAFAIANDVAKRSFNSIAFGSYLLWDAYGERRTFIDGRNFDPALYRDFLLAQATEAGFAEAVRKYRLDGFIVPTWEHGDAGIRNVHQRLVQNGAAWNLVYMDEDAFVYVATESADSSWLGANAYRVYHPATFGGARLDPSVLRQAVRELERATKDAPLDAERWFHLGAAYEASGDWEAARTACDRALAIEPANAGALAMKDRLAGGR